MPPMALARTSRSIARRHARWLLCAALVVCAAWRASGTLAQQAASSTPAAPEPRPHDGDVHAKVKRLWDAIVQDDPALASDVFFPRDPFLSIKNIRDPGRYYDRLRKRFDQDIHTLHKETPDLQRAVFVRFQLAHRGGYVAVREEGNRLPYWASRHSRVFYRVDGELRSFEVRVLIAWSGAWYVIHLNEFHSPT